MAVPFKAMGIKSFNSIKNLGNLGQMMFIYFGTFLFWYIVFYVNFTHSYSSFLYSYQRLKKDPKARKEKYDSMKWGPLLGFCYRGFIPLCISTQLNWAMPMYTTTGEFIALCWTVFLSCIIYIWLPITMLRVILAS